MGMAEISDMMIKGVKACGVNHPAIYGIHATSGQGAPTPFRVLSLDW